MSAKPNIVMIFSDHLRSDALGCMGGLGVTPSPTPNIDTLAADGCLFSHTIVTQPTCTPSRASVLTGRMPSVLRTRMVGCSLPECERTLPEVLTENGYRTASIGKLHLRPQRAEGDFIGNLREGESYYGFGEVDLVNGHGDACFGNKYTPWLESKYHGCLKSERVPVGDLKNTFESRVPLDGWSSEYITERAEEFLSSSDISDKPFLLHISFPDPHPMARSFTVPAPYDRMFDNIDINKPTPPFTKSSGVTQMYENARHGKVGAPNDFPIGTPSTDFASYTENEWRLIRSRYLGAVALLDKCVGRILNSINSSALSDNTVVIFLSDHGDYLGDHGLFGKGFPFEAAIHVPMIFNGVGVEHNKYDGVASTLDIMPTVLEMLGIAEPVGVQGLSFASLLRGEADGYTRRVALTENDDDIAKLRIRTVTTKEFQLNCYSGGEYFELFDMINDPKQTKNVYNAPSYADVSEKMKSLLLEEVICTCDTVNGRTQKPKPPVVKWISESNRKAVL